jgi:site-specific DNA-cytosine methylase
LARSSQESGGWTSDSPEPDSSTPSSASEIPTGDESSPDTGRESRSGRTFETWAIQDIRINRDQNGLGISNEGVAYTLNKTESQSIFSAEASPAKTSPSPADGEDSQAIAPASSSSSHESLTLFSPMEAGSSLRTYPDFFPPTVDEISPSYSRRWPSSGFTTSPGECWTADTSECPSEGAASSSLPDVLEADVHPRFYLSPKAAAGILRRAEKRGKPLPEELGRVLLKRSKQRETAAPPREQTTTPTSFPTLRGFGHGWQGQHNDDSAKAGMVRRLTPTECERLQALPDGWTWVPSTGRAGAT